MTERNFTRLRFTCELIRTLAPIVGIVLQVIVLSQVLA